LAAAANAVDHAVKRWPRPVAFQIREDAIATLAADCRDRGFEMLTAFHGASPDREMFPGD
jgi:hypothetical protein